MLAIILVCVAIFFVVRFIFYKSADKQEERFNNRPSVINNPEKDLFTNQKYAIVGLLAHAQGASALSAYNDEATSIAQSVISSLGLSQSEVEKHLMSSMRHSPKREFTRMLNSLDEIRDRKYLKGIFDKAMYIARISGNQDEIDALEHVMKEMELK